MTHFLEAEGLRHSYPGTLELDVAHIGADRGEVLCILGPSGAGKSTLLRIMSIIEKPMKGVVRLGGRRVRRSLSARRRMAAALQSPTLWRGTVGSNVEFGLRVRGVGWRERRARIEYALAEVGLTGFEDRPASEISGGEAQRAGLARALVLEPEVLFLDEPLAHVDEPLRESLAMTLRKFTLRTGCATIWVTHDRSEALSIADRIALIDGGSLLQSGPASEVFSKPRDERAARIVGADNLLRGTVVRSDSGLVQVDVGGAEIEAASTIPEGAEVIALIRPEAILVWKEAPEGAGPRNRLRARLGEVSPRGSVVKLLLESDPPLIAVVTPPTFEDLGVAPGDTLWTGFKATSVHVIRRS